MKRPLRVFVAGAVACVVVLASLAYTETLSASRRPPSTSALTAEFVNESGNGPHPFGFVSNFEDLQLDGWTPLLGSAHVVTNPSYEGEPVLESKAGPLLPQVDLVTRGFGQADPFLSFQAEVHAAAHARGFVGLAGSAGPIAVIGVGSGSVWAGPSLGAARVIAPIPANTAQPAGWVYLLANVYEKGGGSHAKWVMDVYVDRTDRVARVALPVPDAGAYRDALIVTLTGTVDYTNIIFTSYQIPTTAPLSIYNPMDGYGQGMGLWVRLLPAFTLLSASFTLSNWSSPEVGVLSFQINAMNRVGTVQPACEGFFQLGIDVDPGGKIAPWYVRGNNCNPHYFGHTGPGGSWAGFASPPGTKLKLSILDEPLDHAIVFNITDISVKGPDRYWSAAIPYDGTEFFSTFTQLEWQPSSSYPIDRYFFSGTMSHLDIAGGNLSNPRPLSAAYMLPIVIDAPPSWNLGYYSGAAAGYSQIG